MALCCSWTCDAKQNNGKDFHPAQINSITLQQVESHNEIALHLEALYSFVLTRGPDAGMPCKWLLGWTLALQTHHCAVVAIIVSHGTMTTSQTRWLTRVCKRVSEWSYVDKVVYIPYFLKLGPLQMHLILHHMKETKDWEDKKLSRKPSCFTFI